MGKFKVENINNQVVVKYRMDLFETLNKNEIEYFNRNLMRGLLKPTLNGFRMLEYKVPDSIPLHQYIKKEFTRDSMFNIILQALSVIKKIDQSDLDSNNIKLNLDTTFINENTKEVFFTYVPTKDVSRQLQLGSFVSDMAYSAVFAANEDISSINDLVNYVGSLEMLSIRAVEEYINGPEEIPEKNKHVCFDDEATVFMDDDATVFLDDETTALINDEEGTVLLETEPEIHIYLLRIKSCEEIEISKPSFVIGKDENKADLVITDNNAISRVHMELTCIEGRYFVRDNNSTNGTYVNEVLLEKGTSVEIFDGDEIRLANEDFEFHIETVI